LATPAVGPSPSALGSLSMTKEAQWGAPSPSLSQAGDCARWAILGTNGPDPPAPLRLLRALVHRGRLAHRRCDLAIARRVLLVVVVVVREARVVLWDDLAAEPLLQHVQNSVRVVAAESGDPGVVVAAGPDVDVVGSVVQDRGLLKGFLLVATQADARKPSLG